MKTMLKIGLLATAAVWLGGCASPETRIRRDPATFNRLTPEQQAKVKEGRVALGLDGAAVRLALGRPDRVVERTDASGTTEIWHYLTYDQPDIFYVNRGWPHYHRRWMTGFEAVLISEPSYSTRARAKVIFRGGVVVAYEEAR